MSRVKLNITPIRPSEIPADDAIISAARALIEESLLWEPGKLYENETVQTAHALLEDGSSWHSRASQHSLPFDQFWSVMGHLWMPAKKAFNDKYIHEIKKVTLLKTLSPTTSIWTILYGFPPPVSPRVFTVVQVTHLDESTPRTGWVIHMPIDLTGPEDVALLAQEDRSVKGRYACVEKITELPNGRTEWRLVTSSTPAGLIPKFLADKSLPARISLDVTSFIDWYNTCYLRKHTIDQDSEPALVNSTFSLSAIGYSLALLNVLTYVAYKSSAAPTFQSWIPARAALCAIWVPGLYAIYAQLTKPDPHDTVPKKDRLLIGMRDPMIPATIELGALLPLGQALVLVSERLLAIPRMAHRLVVPSAGAPYWEPCAKLDLSAHVREHHLPPDSGYADLRACIEQLGRTPVDPSHPPWDIAVIQRPGGGGSVLFTRVHHAITDGRGLTALLTACADDNRNLLTPRAPPPLSPPRGVFSRIAQAVRNVRDLANLDRPKEPLSSIKREAPLEAVAIAWVQRPLALADLKRVADRLGGGTLNDVVLAAVAGALRRYMRAHGDDVDKMAAIQCKVPVDVFTGSGGDVVLGTHLGDLNVPLPTDVGAPAGRYARVRATMRQAKAGYRAGLAAAMSGVVGGLPTKTRLTLIATDAKTVSCYVSNMKGPAAPMHVGGGIAVANVRCHPLGLNNIGVGFAVYSYNGQVNVAVCTDRDVVAEPDVLCGYFEDELQQLTVASVNHPPQSSVGIPRQSPRFSSAYSVVLPYPIEAVGPVLLPADAAAISRFLVGTRDSSLKLAADFIHHSTDSVRMDIPAEFASDALPAIHELAACDEQQGQAPILQRDCFTVIERAPILFGLLSQTVTVKSWQVLDHARSMSAYESVVAGAGVRVWKVRTLEDMGEADVGDGIRRRRTRVTETLKGVCPWWLQGIVRENSAATHRAAMDKYCEMMAAWEDTVLTNRIG